VSVYADWSNMEMLRHEAEQHAERVKELTATLAREREAREKAEAAEKKSWARSRYWEGRFCDEEAARSQLEAAVEKLRHLLSSPGSMGYNEIRAEGLAIIESALRSSRGEGTGG
jgi:hypothetical protein